MEPTKEQKQELWEWCGFKQVKCEYASKVGLPIWEYPNGKWTNTTLKIDLNNLFKYAVPFVFEKYGWVTMMNILLKWARLIMKDYSAYKGEEAQALFWVLYEVMNHDHKS